MYGLAREGFQASGGQPEHRWFSNTHEKLFLGNDLQLFQISFKLFQMFVFLQQIHRHRHTHAHWASYMLWSNQNFLSCGRKFWRGRWVHLNVSFLKCRLRILEEKQAEVFMSFIEDSTAKFTGHDVHWWEAVKLLSVEKDQGRSSEF